MHLAKRLAARVPDRKKLLVHFQKATGRKYMHAVDRNFSGHGQGSKSMPTCTCAGVIIIRMDIRTYKPARPTLRVNMWPQIPGYINSCQGFTLISSSFLFSSQIPIPSRRSHQIVSLLQSSGPSCVQHLHPSSRLSASGLLTRSDAAICPHLPPSS